jgi:hypothetical protein
MRLRVMLSSRRLLEPLRSATFSGFWGSEETPAWAVQVSSVFSLRSLRPKSAVQPTVVARAWLCPPLWFRNAWQRKVA